MKIKPILNPYLFISIAVVFFLLSCESAQQKVRRIELKKADSTRVADSLKIEKAASLGIWKLGNYVDEFGEPTKTKYIVNSSPIVGSFSNSVTEGSILLVKIMMDQKDTYIQLYEYAGSNPVKERGINSYKIKIKSCSDEIFELSAFNYSDRLSLDEGLMLRKILLKCDKVQFLICEDTARDYALSHYKFTIEDTGGLNNAIKRLEEEEPNKQPSI